MPFVATAGYADCLDPAVANHGLQHFRFTSDEQGQAFRGLVPNIWWDSVVGLPGQDRPVMLFSDAQMFAYSVVREIKGAALARVWLVSPLTSGACEQLLLWALNAVERTACSFGGALGRMAEKAKAHDNTDVALSLDDTSYLVLPADLPGAGNDAAMWLQELTVGAVAAQDGGPRALGWLEWHRAGVQQVRQPAIETLRTCASRLGRLDNVLPHPGTVGDRQEWCEASGMLGAYMELAVVSEITKWCALEPTAPELRFWSKTAVSEVDLVVSNRGYHIPFEIKLGERYQAKWLRGLDAFEDDHASLGLAVPYRFVVHSGEPAQLDARTYLLPLWCLT